MTSFQLKSFTCSVDIDTHSVNIDHNTTNHKSCHFLAMAMENIYISRDALLYGGPHFRIKVGIIIMVV